MKIQVNSLGKAYLTSNNKLLKADTDTITAVNNTGSNITSGSKVWVNKNGNGYGLIKFFSDLRNFVVSGSPTIDDTTGQINNFSISNYLTINQIPSNISSFEFVFRVKTPASLESSHMCILGQSSANYKTPQLELGSAGSFYVMATAAGSSPWASTFNTLSTQTTVSFNTWYWLKATWNGDTLNLYLSTDNQTWNHEGTVACSAAYWGENARVGRDNDTSSIYTGMIDLKNSYININGQRWWTPYMPAVNENTSTGIAQENISAGSSGSVKVMEI